MNPFRLVNGSTLRPLGENLKVGKQAEDFNFDDYQPFDTIVAWLNKLAEDNDGVEVVSIGRSYEGRDTPVLTITRAGQGAPNVWVEAGIHSREWISPAVATWILDALLTTEAGEDYTQKFNFHFSIVTNPDGYDYSWTDVSTMHRSRVTYSLSPLRDMIDTPH